MTQEEREVAWKDWLLGRPDFVRVVAERFPPWVPVRIKSTGQKAHVYSFGGREDGTVSIQVDVFAEENPDSLHSVFLPGGHRVFGLDVDDLEPYDRDPAPRPVSQPGAGPVGARGSANPGAAQGGDMSHRWSGWPGAWCLDCGQLDPLELALSCPKCSVSSGPGDIDPSYDALCGEHAAMVRGCPEPGSDRHNPYARERP